MSKDGKKPLGDSSVFQQGRDACDLRTNGDYCGFVSGADYSNRRRSEFLPSVHTDVFRRLYGAWTRHCAFDSE